MESLWFRYGANYCNCKDDLGCIIRKFRKIILLFFSLYETHFLNLLAVEFLVKCNLGRSQGKDSGRKRTDWRTVLGFGLKGNRKPEDEEGRQERRETGGRRTGGRRREDGGPNKGMVAPMKCAPEKQKTRRFHGVNCARHGHAPVKQKKQRGWTG